MPEWQYGRVADIFSVISDPTRREILDVLHGRRRSGEAGEATVSELVTALGLAQPTVSKHLRTLRDAGLVHVREAGPHRYYRIDAIPLEIVEDWLLPFLVDDELDADGGIGAAAFAAWAGTNVTKPLRDVAERVTEVVEHPGQLGTSIGRRAAEAAHSTRQAAHDVQERFQEASERAAERWQDGTKKLGGRRKD